jgi:polyisoprenoid-binding protein YceI
LATIRGVTKQEKLTFALPEKRTGSGTISGTMAFDRKQYGMNSGIPFIKIADRVGVKPQRETGQWASRELKVIVTSELSSPP